jgi:hypothetical protein
MTKHGWITEVAGDWVFNAEALLSVAEDVTVTAVTWSIAGMPRHAIPGARTCSGNPIRRAICQASVEEGAARVEELLERPRK